MQFGALGRVISAALGAVARMSWRGWGVTGLIAVSLILGGWFTVRISRSCVAHGKRYYAGEAVPSGTCNSCACDRGRVLCTLLGCPTPFSLLHLECHTKEHATDTATAWLHRERFKGRSPSVTLRAVEEDTQHWRIWAQVDDGQANVEEGVLRVSKIDCRAEWALRDNSQAEWVQ